MKETASPLSVREVHFNECVGRSGRRPPVPGTEDDLADVTGDCGYFDSAPRKDSTQDALTGEAFDGLLQILHSDLEGRWEWCLTESQHSAGDLQRSSRCQGLVDSVASLHTIA